MATRQTKAEMAENIRVLEARNEGMAAQIVEADENYAALEAAYSECLETIEALRAQLQEQAERQADEAVAKTPIGEIDETVIDRVNHRVNEYGDVLNVRLAEGYDGPVTFAAMAKALGTTIAPRGKRREDKNGRVWIDLYPSVSQSEEVAA